MRVLNSFFMVTAFAALTVAAPARAAETCQVLNGRYTAVTPQACDSLVGICTHGTLTGNFPSIYDFTAMSMRPLNATGIYEYSGHSTITEVDGQVFYGSDRGIMQLSQDGTTAHYATFVKLQGAEGYILATGTLSFITGNSTGNYSGFLCK